MIFLLIIFILIFISVIFIYLYTHIIRFKADTDSLYETVEEKIKGMKR